MAETATDTIGIRFRGSSRTYCFKTGETEVKRGDRVVVESDMGINIADVVKIGFNTDIADKDIKKILRKVTEADLVQEKENDEVRKDAREYGVQRIRARGLAMKLLSTEVTLDRKRFIFYFIAESRIDFRELVKDLASRFKTRIELRQIGVRDASKMIGGFGICGREFCCKSFLKGFAPISIKMAKQQDLVLNTCKLSGQCGRLMCCLNYEYYPGEGKRKKPPKAAPKDNNKTGRADATPTAGSSKAQKSARLPELSMDILGGQQARDNAHRKQPQQRQEQGQQATAATDGTQPKSRKSRRSRRRKRKPGGAPQQANVQPNAQGQQNAKGNAQRQPDAQAKPSSGSATNTHDTTGGTDTQKKRPSRRRRNRRGKKPEKPPQDKS